MHNQTWHVKWFAILIAASPTIACSQARQTAKYTTEVTVTIDRGRDLGQGFGSLFEATSRDGSLALGAGFQNLYKSK